MNGDNLAVTLLTAVGSLLKCLYQITADRRARRAGKPDWEIWEAAVYISSHSRSGQGKSLAEIERDLRQVAALGHIAVWGQRDHRTPTIPIPSNYFEKAGFQLEPEGCGGKTRPDPEVGSFLSTSHPIYYTLYVNKRQILKEWPERIHRLKEPSRSLRGVLLPAYSARVMRSQLGFGF